MILMSEKQMADFSIYETAGKAYRQSKKNKKMIKLVIQFMIRSDEKFRKYMRINGHENKKSKTK